MLLKASGEITHLPLLEAMSLAAFENQLPVYLSTGMCTLGEVEEALNIFLSNGLSREQITIMHCVSSYPTPLEEVNLNILHTLRSAFGCNIGFSDHTLGITAAISAVTLGATVIEKHLTLDRTMKGPDHLASLEPIEFQQMVNAIREVELILGSNIKVPQPSELNTRSVARRSIRAAKYQQRRKVKRIRFSISKTRWISPMLYKKLLGSTVWNDINQGDIFNLENENHNSHSIAVFTASRAEFGLLKTRVLRNSTT